MSNVYRLAFLAAVAAASIVALTSSPSAQEAKKETKTETAAEKKSALQGSDEKMMREMAQSDLAEVQAGKLPPR